MTTKIKIFIDADLLGTFREALAIASSTKGLSGARGLLDDFRMLSETDGFLSLEEPDARLLRLCLSYAATNHRPGTIGGEQFRTAEIMLETAIARGFRA